MIAPAAEAAPRPDVRSWRRRLTIFLAILGPGFITANVDNDAGGIATYSIAGAHFGYSLLWTLIPITVALIVVQEMSARLGAITGKGLGELIRENYGLRTTFYLMVALLVTDIGNTVAEFAGWAAALEIFGIPRWVSVPIGAFVVWWLVVKGNYKTVEKIFLIACTVYLTYVASALFAKPVWTDVLKQTFEPQIESSAAWILMIIGIVGTTIAPWMQFYLQSSIVEKRIGPEEYRLSRWDVIVGCVVAGRRRVLHRRRLRRDALSEGNPDRGRRAGRARARAARGQVGRHALRLRPRERLALRRVASCRSRRRTPSARRLGFEAGVDKSWSEAPQFNALYTSMIVIGAGIILIPGVPLFPVLFLSQVLNGLLLPFVLFFVVLLVNRADLMGDVRERPRLELDRVGDRAASWSC